MKRLFTAFCIALTALLFLQSCAKKIVVGAGKSEMTGEPSWTDPIGAQVSIEAKIVEVSKVSELTGGLGFSYQGSKYKEPSFSGVVRTSYLNFPLLYNYHHPNGFYAEAGLQPAILLSAKDKYNGSSYDYKDEMKTFELGLPVGAGYVMKSGLGIGIRIIPGLTKNHKEGNSRNLLMLAMLSFELDSK
jgi:hypothetical protein